MKNIIIILLCIITCTLINAQSFQDSPSGSQGDFPPNWDLVRGSAEIASLNGSPIIYFSNKGIITPKIGSSNYLNNSFNLEFDAFFDGARRVSIHQYYEIRFWEGSSFLKLSDNKGGFYNPMHIYVNGAKIDGKVNSSKVKYDGYRETMKENKNDVWRHISITYNNGAFKVSIDNILLVNIPHVEFKPTMISIGVYTVDLSTDLVRAIKNISLSDGLVNNDPFEDSDNNNDTSDETQEQINPIIAGEGGTVTSSPNALVPASAVISPEIIDDIIIKEMIRQNLPGVAIGVYKKGLIDYTKGYGYLDLGKTIPITDNTVMRWASISKTMTAVAVLQLQERRNDFNINDKVIDHYPHWTSKYFLKKVEDKDRKKQITIKNLLNNRSGINQYNKGIKDEDNEYPDSGSSYDPKNRFNANSAINIFRTAALDFNPGDNYLYSSYGFTLLGAVIDEITGSYPNWIENSIGNKLDMTSLKVGNGNFTGFQKQFDGILKEKKIGSKESVLPGGGWESNIKDLLKFAKGINNEDLLQNTSNLWKDDGNLVKNKDGNDVSQSYKRGIESAGSGDNIRVWHGGDHSNMTTLLYVRPKQDIAVVLLIPLTRGDRDNIKNLLLKELGISTSPLYTPVEKCNSKMKSSSKKFVGVWRKTNKGVIIRRGLTTIQFKKEWQFLSYNGYYLKDIEPFKNGDGVLVWEGVFKKGTGQYAMWRNFDRTGFHNKWEEMNSMGYRLYDIETYKLNGVRLWAGLFKKSTGKAALRRYLTFSEFATAREEYAQMGLKLIDIETFVFENQLLWAGVWVPGEEGILNRNVKTDDFFGLIFERARNGYKLIDIETYSVNGVEFKAGIWEKSNEEQRFILGGKNYCKFMDDHDSFSADDYELIDLESYND